MLRAALEVIVERGYAETRIADVAERTGTSPALVIYYFKTRDQLLTEAISYSDDTWYAESLRRMEEIPTAAGRLAELIAMNCLPGTDPEPRSYWLLWLDLWAFSPRSPGVAAVRQKSDERWREAIRSVVRAGQEADEFAPVDADDFTISTG
jgi:AcrR family transcriptional regulator